MKKLIQKYQRGSFFDKIKETYNNTVNETKEWLHAQFNGQPTSSIILSNPSLKNWVDDRNYRAKQYNSNQKNVTNALTNTKMFVGPAYSKDWFGRAYPNHTMVVHTDDPYYNSQRSPQDITGTEAHEITHQIDFNQDLSEDKKSILREAMPDNIMDLSNYDDPDDYTADLERHAINSQIRSKLISTYGITGEKLDQLIDNMSDFALAYYIKSGYIKQGAYSGFFDNDWNKIPFDDIQAWLKQKYNISWRTLSNPHLIQERKNMILQDLKKHFNLRDVKPIFNTPLLNKFRRGLKEVAQNRSTNNRDASFARKGYKLIRK